MPAPSQTVQPLLTWEDTSNEPVRPDGWAIYQCMSALPCTPAIKVAEVMVTHYPRWTRQYAFTDTVRNDPGNRTICYAVAAFNAVGESAKSNTACMTTAALKPPPGPTPSLPSAPAGLVVKMI